MLLGIVFLLELVHADLAIIVEIQCLVGFLDERHSEGVHVANVDSEELVKADFATVIGIHRFEKADDILVFDLHAEILDALNELRLTQKSRSVIIGDLELSLESDNAAGSPLCKSSSEPFDQDSLEFGSNLLGLNFEYRLEFFVLRSLGILSIQAS